MNRPPTWQEYYDVLGPLELVLHSLRAAGTWIMVPEDGYRIILPIDVMPDATELLGLPVQHHVVDEPYVAIPTRRTS